MSSESTAAFFGQGFWLAKHLVSGLLLPPASLLALQIVAFALWRRRPRAARAVFGLTLVGWALVTIPAISVHYTAWMEYATPAVDLEDPHLRERADAIVVLGGGRTLEAHEYGRGNAVSPDTFQRIRYGADLWRRTRRPMLLTGGSPGQQGESEAALMSRALRSELGGEAKWLEERANNTAQNAEYSAAILLPQGVRRVFLVTHAWHMPRARRSFELAGFEVVPAPLAYLSDGSGGFDSPLAWVPSAQGVELSAIASREAVGAFWYRLRQSD